MKVISGIGAAVAALVAVSTVQAAGPKLDVHLDPGTLLACLEGLAAQAQVRIVDASGRASTARCAGLRERLDLAHSLDHLLAPAGLAWRRRDEGTVEILEAVARTHLALAGLTVQGSPLDEPPRPDGRAPSLLAERAQGLSRIDSPWLDDAPLLGFDQLGRFAPNIYGAGQGLAIRGTERDQDTFPALTVTFDGIELGARLLDNELVPLDGLDHIDFARGPRSFEAGGETVAGTIRLVTAAPSSEPQLRTTIGVGESGERRGGVEWSGPIDTTGLGATVAIEQRELPQFLRQAAVPSANRDHRDNDSARMKLSFVPDYLPGLSAEFSGLSLSGDSSDRWIVRAPTQADGSQAPLDFRDRVSYDPAPVVARTVARGAAGVVRYHFNAVAELELSGSGTKIERNGAIYPLRDITTLDTESRQRVGADLYLQWGPAWKLALGLERADADLRRVFYEYDPSAPLPNAPSDGRDYIESHSDPEFAQRSARVWLEYAPNATFSAGLGVRWQRDRVEQDVSSRQCPDDVRPPCQNVVFEEIGVARSQMPIPMASVEWRPWSNQTFTLSHGRGYRSAGSVTAEQQFVPEQSQSTEASWRGTWLDDRLHTSVTAFSSRTRHRFTYLIYRLSTAVDADGAEVEMEADLTSRWHVRAGIGHVNSHYAGSLGRPSDPIDPITPGAPSHTAVLGLRYGAAQGVYATLDAYHASDAESVERGAGLLRRPAYSVVDLRLGLRRANWDTALIVGNALDATYIDRAEQPVIPYQPTLREQRFRLGDPRRIEWRTSWTW